MTDYILIPLRTLKRGLWRQRISITDWYMRSRERAQLLNLSDDALEDCGLSRADIEGEVRRLRW